MLAMIAVLLILIIVALIWYSLTTRHDRMTVYPYYYDVPYHYPVYVVPDHNTNPRTYQFCSQEPCVTWAG